MTRTYPIQTELKYVDHSKRELENFINPPNIYKPFLPKSKIADSVFAVNNNLMIPVAPPVTSKIDPRYEEFARMLRDFGNDGRDEMLKELARLRKQCEIRDLDISSEYFIHPPQFNKKR